jgi:hypothetical protein
MQRLNINGNLYIVKRKFSFNRIKDENALADIKHYYGADYLIKDIKNQKYILASKVEDAIIIEEKEN